MTRLAVVLFNLGGPDGPEAVKPFLTNLFSDPAIISLPAILRLPLARMIAGGREETAKAKQALVERLKTVLGLDVADVRVSHRLTDSPAILAMGQGDLGVQMRQLLEASGQQVPESKPVFEFNPDHPLIARLDAEGDPNRFNSLTRVLFDQAALAAGESLKDPAGYVKRLNALLLELSA